ncbi:hypothetical protein Q3G72_021950 [Acer saccharum]|nr:hypothetical protein Q3G72_021950 [Acer saccharum]
MGCTFERMCVKLFLRYLGMSQQAAPAKGVSARGLTGCHNKRLLRKECQLVVSLVSEPVIAPGFKRAIMSRGSHCMTRSDEVRSLTLP